MENILDKLNEEQREAVKTTKAREKKQNGAWEKQEY